MNKHTKIFVFIINPSKIQSCKWLLWIITDHPPSLSELCGESGNFRKNCPTYPLVQNISHIQVFAKSRLMAIKSTLSDWNSKHSWSVRVSRRETRGFVSGIFSMLDQIVLIPGEPLILRFSFPLLLLIPLDKLWHIFTTTKTIVLQSSNPDSCFFPFWYKLLFFIKGLSG